MSTLFIVQVAFTKLFPHFEGFNPVFPCGVLVYKDLGKIHLLGLFASLELENEVGPLLGFNYD